MLDRRRAGERWTQGALEAVAVTYDGERIAKSVDGGAEGVGWVELGVESRESRAESESREWRGDDREQGMNDGDRKRPIPGNGDGRGIRSTVGGCEAVYIH